MKLLLPIDGSRYALGAARFVGEYLAQPGRHVDLLHVIPLVVQEGAAPPRHQPEHLRVSPAARAWLDRAERRLTARGFTVARHVRRGVPARVIPQFVEKGAHDLVVLGAKGRSAHPYLPTGSVALAILEQHVPANVLLVRERELDRQEDMPSATQPYLVLFPTDGSERAAHAAQTFYRLCSIARLTPIGVAVTELPDAVALLGMEVNDRRRLISQLRAATRRWARDVKPLLARPGVRPQVQVLEGRPATAVTDEAARRGARLIVLSSRGARSPSGPPLGSVALQIARYAPCSVLLVRKG